MTAPAPLLTPPPLRGSNLNRKARNMHGNIYHGKLGRGLSTFMAAHLLGVAEKTLHQVYREADFFSHEDRGRIRDIGDMLSTLQRKCKGSYLEQERRRNDVTAR